MTGRVGWEEERGKRKRGVRRREGEGRKMHDRQTN